MVSVDKNHEMSVAGWTVKGSLLTGGSESPLGGVRYRFKAPKSDVWLPLGEQPPAKVQEQIRLTKIKVKEILRARLAQSKESKTDVKKPAAKAVKAGIKATTAKGAQAKQSKKLVKKPAGKK
mmetsp:Transcript_59552/g.118023  ORF Transcript_59552/g.118023 Transcript_59552/m.118023 type:complete len:122 (-) Transcript_59552:198-563(-)